MKQTIDQKTGRFSSPNPEPMSKRTFAIRLPVSMDAKVRQAAGDDLAGWLRRAIIAQLEREARKSSK